MFFKKDRGSVGLEIGDGLVKAMYIQSSDKENKLLGFEVAKVNFREGRNGIIKAIKEVLSKLPINPKKCRVNISVSGESVVVRDIHWPQMSEEEIKKALKFEVERQVHYKMEEIVFDYYSVLDKSVAETKTRVVLIAAKKDLIENYASLVTESGYNCGFVEVDTFSLLNCFYLNGPEVKAEKTIAIINVGEEVTNIDIVKGKIVGLTKDAFVAWNNLMDALPDNFQLDFSNIAVLKGMLGSDDIYELCSFIMNALSNQIRRTIEFFEGQGQDTVDEIFLCGKVAMFKNLDKHLQEVLGLKVTLWDPISKITFDPKLFKKNSPKENSLMLALCTGLAAYRCFNINLFAGAPSAKQGKVRQLVSQYREFLNAGVIFVFILFGLWLTLLSQIKIKEANQKKLAKENEKILKIVQDVEDLKKGRQMLKGHVLVAKALFSRRVLWSQKLYEISKCVPADVWIIDLALEDLLSKKESLADSLLNTLSNLSDNIVQQDDKDRKNRVVFIKGIVYSDSNDKMLSVINKFISNLNNNRTFNEDFKHVELIRTYNRKVLETDVMQFEVECF